MGKPVTAMSAIELVSYVKTWLRAVYELELPVTANRERFIFSALIRTYGVQGAGRIVKWPFWRYDGKRSNGEFVTYSHFTKGMKWQTDIWYLELQEHLKKESKKTTTAAAAGFGKLQDL